MQSSCSAVGTSAASASVAVVSSRGLFGTSAKCRPFALRSCAKLLSCLSYSAQRLAWSGMRTERACWRARARLLRNGRQANWALVADEPAREAGEDRCQDRLSRTLCGVPACRGRRAAQAVRKNSAAHRSAPATANAAPGMRDERTMSIQPAGGVRPILHKFAFGRVAMASNAPTSRGRRSRGPPECPCRLPPGSIRRILFFNLTANGEAQIKNALDAPPPRMPRRRMPRRFMHDAG